MIARRLVPWLGVAVSAAVLGACAETQLVSHTVKVFESPKTPQAGAAPKQPGGAGYKIGKPYQVDGLWYYPAEDFGYAETGIASWYGPDFHGKPTANGEIYDMNDLTAAHKTLPMPSMVRVINLDNGRALALRVNDRGPFVRGRIVDVSRRAAQLLGFDRIGTAKVRVEIIADESRQLAALARRKPGAEDVVVAAAPSASVSVETLAPPGAAPPAAPVKQQSTAAKPSPAATEAEPRPSGEVAIVPVKATGIYVQAGAFANPTNAERLSAKLSAIAPARVEQATVGNQVFWRVRVGPAADVADADRILERVGSAGYPEARVIVE